MDRIIENLKSNKFLRATGIRCARTFLSTILGVWTAGTLVTEIDWKAMLVSAISSTILIFLTCCYTGLPEVGDKE